MSGLNKKAPVIAFFLSFFLIGLILLNVSIRNSSERASDPNLADLRLVRVLQSDTHLSDFPTTRVAEFYAGYIASTHSELELYFEPYTNSGAVACSLGRFWIQDADSPEQVARKFLRGEGRKM